MFAGPNLSAPEAERLVEALQPIDISEVGMPKWKQQREAVERLNVQAHVNLAQNRDEFVYEALLSHKKVPVLIHELLTIEVWGQRVYPLLKSELQQSPTGSYMLLHYEAVVSNLLESVAFNADAITTLDDELLELCDYCHRCLQWLNSRPASLGRIEEQPKDPKQLLAQTDEEMESRTALERRFKIAMMGLSILWFIVDKIPQLEDNLSLQMGLLNNLLVKHDTILQLCSLLCNPPWVRIGQKGRMQKYRDGEWKEVAPSERLLLAPHEAHVWMALHMLLCDRGCRQKYKYDEYRKEEVLRVRRFLSDTLLDQIPALADVQRALDELQILEPPRNPEDQFRASLVVEAFPQLYAGIVRNRDWPAIARKQAAYLTSRDVMMEDAQRLARLLDSLGFGGGGEGGGDDDE